MLRVREEIEQLHYSFEPLMEEGTEPVPVLMMKLCFLYLSLRLYLPHWQEELQRHSNVHAELQDAGLLNLHALNVFILPEYQLLLSRDTLQLQLQDGSLRCFGAN